MRRLHHGVSRGRDRDDRRQGNPDAGGRLRRLRRLPARLPGGGDFACRAGSGAYDEQAVPGNKRREAQKRVTAGVPHGCPGQRLRRFAHPGAEATAARRSGAQKQRQADSVARGRDLHGRENFAGLTRVSVVPRTLKSKTKAPRQNFRLCCRGFFCRFVFLLSVFRSGHSQYPTMMRTSMSLSSST